MSLSDAYAPNPLPANVSPGDTNWHVIASDGTPYTTMALLLAAGKRPYPGIDPGGRIKSCLLRSITTAGAPGSGVLYKLDPKNGTAPTTIADADNEVGGSDQQVSLKCPFRIIWLKALSATDYIKLDGRH